MRIASSSRVVRCCVYNERVATKQESKDKKPGEAKKCLRMRSRMRIEFHFKIAK